MTVTLISFLSSPSVNAYSVWSLGSLKGRVIFEGSPPAVETVKVKSDTPTCGNQKKIPKILLGKDNGVANAVVILRATQEGIPRPFLEPKQGILDQINCEFVPHVQVLTVGSTLNITSSDAVLHNAHAFREDGSTAFNIAVPIPGMVVTQKLDEPGVIKLRCDAGHTWMSAYVVVTDEFYYALTDADGNFSIEAIPVGDYEIEVWQEWLGWHTESLEIKESEQSLTLTLKPSSL
jgi:hypothetical protein